jgi:hypothetical protein
METVIARPANKEQLTALKAIMKALKVDFTTEKSAYSPEFLAKIERAEEQIKDGKYRKITPSDIWK